MTKGHLLSILFSLVLVSVISTIGDQATALSQFLEPDLSRAPAGGTGVGPVDDGPHALEIVPVGAVPEKTDGVQGLESSLENIQKSFRTEGWTGAAQAASDTNMPLVNGETRVIISTESSRTEEVASAISAIGIQIEGSYGELVQAMVPADRISDISSIPGVIHVRTPLVPVTMAVASEGLSVTGASSWQAMGFSGKGVKIGVLDVGFEGYLALLGTELPLTVTLNSMRTDRDITGEGANHGSAVAEIVYDVAPESSYYFANFQTEVEFAKAVEWMVGEGVNVIVSAVGWPGGGPGDGTGSINGIVKAAKQKGVFWAQAAGNFGQTHWTGPYRDTNGNNFHEFAAGDEGNTITLTPSGKGETIFTVEIILTWDDWQTFHDDYDLFLFRGDTVVAQSTSFQGGSFPPVERLKYTTATPGDYWVAVQRFKARRSDRLDIVTTIDYRLQYKVPSESLVIPADSPDAVAVGAVSLNDFAIQSYSSQGPTKDGRIKPDLVVPDGVSTVTYGANAFPGTSATAPLIGGIAALVKQAAPRYTPDQIAAFLEAGTTRLGSSQQNNVYGFGLLKLLQPPPRVMLPIVFSGAILAR
ncbi:MAG: hypothetical protein EXR50_04745 [Dehalococcoidia bacterium]|nr:hypothetical protein [Dehalococcoidia bacterium]